MGKFLLTVIAMIPSIALAEEPKPSAKLTLYKTADSAACSGDVAVWVDSDTHLYYLKGDKLYGKTQHGGYNCRQQTDAAGYRAFSLVKDGLRAPKTN